MKKQEMLTSTFIVSLIVFLSIFANSCSKKPQQIQPTKIQLEIKETISGMASYTGNFLIFQMYNNREVEFDSVRNVELPLSETNLFRKKIILSEEDTDEIKNILLDLENSELKNSYSPLEEWKTVDVAHNTEVIFVDSMGKNRTVKLLGNIGQFLQIKDEQSFPKSLLQLLEKVYNIRF